MWDVKGLPAEAYQRLTMPVKRRLVTRLWNILTGTTRIPAEFANVVHPSYKKRAWAQPENCQPIVCTTTEINPVWTPILARIAPSVFPKVPASMSEAMAGRSPHEAIIRIHHQNTALDKNPYQMIVASLNVQSAPPHARHRLLTEVWDAMGPPFLPFMAGYIQTRLYAVITAAGLTPCDRRRQRHPPGRRQGPLPLPSRHPSASVRAGTGIPGIRPIPATVLPSSTSRTTTS